MGVFTWSCSVGEGLCSHPSSIVGVSLHAVVVLDKRIDDYS